MTSCVENKKSIGSLSHQPNIFASCLGHFFVLQFSNYVPQGLVCSFNLSIHLTVVRCCCSLTYSKLSTQLSYDLTSKTLTLVNYNLLWGTKYGDEPLIETVHDCRCFLVFSDVCPHISSEVIYHHEDILDLWHLVQIHGRFDDVKSKCTS